VRTGLWPRAPGLGLTLIALVGCGRDPEIGSCRDSIGGMWRDAQGRRWAVMDHGPRVEAFPDWPDTAPPPGAPTDLEIAPRVIDLNRVGGELSGAVHRRFMKGADGCDPSVPIRVRACRGKTLELELADPPAPTGFSPCEIPLIAPPMPQTWTRERPL
jgi:hypothetical protein